MVYNNIISIGGKEYALFKRGPLSDHPYMINLSTGKVPEHKQRPLLKEFLYLNGIDIGNKNTHWCICEAMRFAEKRMSTVDLISTHVVAPAHQKIMPNTVSCYPPLTKENIEQIHRQVLQDSGFGTNIELINHALCRFPCNTDSDLVAMKISLIDLTNSTRIGMHISRISLQELVKVILDIADFDARLSQGDPDLVSQLAKTNGQVNFFSFASKYCTYHNVAIYKRDDYSIYDNVVEESLPQYIAGFKKSTIRRWKDNYNYAAFNKCIGELLDRNGIQIPFRRRKFDHFLWYANRKR